MKKEKRKRKCKMQHAAQLETPWARIAASGAPNGADVASFRPSFLRSYSASSPSAISKQTNITQLNLGHQNPPSQNSPNLQLKFQQ
jgi:hypothetical protein